MALAKNEKMNSADLALEFELESQWKSFLENEDIMIGSYENNKDNNVGGKYNDLDPCITHQHNNGHGTGLSIGLDPDMVNSKINMDSKITIDSNVMDSNVTDPSANSMNGYTESKKPKPICSDIYISTKTKISYLNQVMNLAEVFWKINVLNYGDQKVGVVKKQMKFNSLCEEELNNVLLKLPESNFVENQIITLIVNPEGRIKFKDVRKISIGISNKDIVSSRRKKRGAFYNCFVVILRIKCQEKFREIHVKVFNTGKLEIPGIQNKEMLDKTLDLLIQELKPLVKTETDLSYIEDKHDTVLINSNFNCGYYINRDKLYSILRYKYKLNCAYDPCSYPGIQCEFHYNKSKDIQTGIQANNLDVENNDYIKVSFMIFRTGSVLIVGKCTEEILDNIYLFLKKTLENEYENVGFVSTYESSNKNNKKNVPTKKRICYKLTK